MSTTQQQMARLIAQEQARQAQQASQPSATEVAAMELIKKEKAQDGYDPNRRALEDGNWYETDTAMGARMVLDGMLMGWSDELISHAGAAYAKLEGAQDDYETLQKQIKYELDEDEQAWRAENPVLATSLNVAGAVLSPANFVAPGASLAAKAGTYGKAAYATARGITEGAVSGAGMAGEGDRLSGAMTGAAFGGGTSMVMQGGGWLWNATTKRRIAQDIVTETVDETGKKTQQIVPITLAANTADEIEEGVASIYKDVIGSVWGGSGAIARQEDAIINPLSSRVSTAKEALDKAIRNTDDHVKTLQRTAKEADVAHRDILKSAVDEVKLKMSGAVDEAREVKINTKEQAQAIAVKTLDDEVRQAEEAFRAQAFFSSLPDGMKSADIDDIVNITIKTPNAAMDLAEKAWKDNGFSMLKNRKFQVNKNELIKQLENAVMKDPVSEFLDPAQVRTLINRTASFLDDKVSKGWIDGNDLSAVRSRYGQILSSLPNSSEGQVMGAIYREMQDVLNTTVQKQLSGKAAKQFADHKAQWKNFTVLRTAVENASKKAGGIGRFTPDDWVAGISKNSKWDLRTGKGPLRQEADKVAIAMKRRDTALKETADAVVKRAEQTFVAQQATIRKQAADEIKRLRARSSETAATNARKVDIQVRKASDKNRIATLQQNYDEASKALQQVTQNATDRTPSIFKRMVALGVLGTATIGGGLGSGGLALVALPAIGRALASPTAQKVFAGQSGVQQASQSAIQSLQRTVPYSGGQSISQVVNQTMARAAGQANTTANDLEEIRRKGLLQ